MPRPTATPEEFARLRAERDRNAQAEAERLAAITGVQPSYFLGYLATSKCYCGCATGGPCEHEWGGWVEWETAGGALCGSTVCSKCGENCMSHDERTMP